VLTIIGIVLVVVSTILIYRAAKQNGHNAVKWTVISAVAGTALELVIPIIAGVIIASMWVAQGKTLNKIQEDILVPGLIIGIACLVLNVAVVALIMKKVSTVVDDQASVAAPPAPTDYNVGG
jgi:hypothetical protein